MKIGIIGTRGIPNYYGGFEQCAQYLSVGLLDKGCTVTVYSSSNHPFQEKLWKGVRLIHKSNPEKSYGPFGQFIYDLNCILDCRKQKFDIILQLGYTSSSIWGWLLPKEHSIITTNMDGLEWMRSKYSPKVQKFLLYAEKLAVKHSHHLISDSLGIQEYLKNKHDINSTFIPYGANSNQDFKNDVLKDYDLEEFKYCILIARLEPENNIETILGGLVISNLNQPFVVVGNYKTKYGKKMREKYGSFSNIKFIGAIYDIDILNNLRYYSNLYFHGHTVGGTNPSLLEAMASNTIICAHNNIFNKSILGEDAYYFNVKEDVKKLFKTFSGNAKLEEINIIKMQKNLVKIENKYSWSQIINEYYDHFTMISELRKKNYKQQINLAIG